MKKRLNNKGFSLIELIITMAISLVIVGAVFTFIYSAKKSYNSSSVRNELQQESTSINKLVGEAIRTGNMDDTKLYVFDNGDYILHTGTKVLYYCSAVDAIAIYDEEADVDAQNVTLESYQTVDALRDGLISKYVTECSFDIEGFELETETDGTASKDVRQGYTESEVTVAGKNAKLRTPESNMIKVTMKITKKGKTESTSNTYEIRN